MVRGRRAAAAPTIAAAAAATSHVDDVSTPPELGPPPPLGAFEIVARARIRRSPRNPRQHFEQAKLDELAAAFRTYGFQGTLTVRRVERDADGCDLELVAGERRWRAADLAGLDQVPVIITDLNDEQAFDIAMIENIQRVDLHPIEEADAYALKRDTFHRSVEVIASQVKKPAKYVRERIQLAHLCEKARAAFLDGRLTVTTALFIARIPDEKDQLDALKEIAANERSDGMSPREAAAFIQGRFMLELAKAPFKITDAELVPSAGPCTTCPHRTGNQRELFDDVKSPDVCTKPPCFRSKVDAWWARRTIEANTAGIRVLTAAEAKKMWPHGDHWLQSSEYRSLDEQCNEDPKRRTLRQLLKKHAQVAAIVRQPNSGAIIELVEKKTVGRALKAAGHDFKREREEAAAASDPARERWRKDQERKQREGEIAKRVDVLAAERVATAVAEKKPDKTFWGFFVELLAMIAADLVGESEVLTRAGLWAENASSADVVKALPERLGVMNEKELRRLAFELQLEQAGGASGELEKTRMRIYEWAGLDVAALKKQAAAEVKAAAKSKTKGRGKKTAAAASDDDAGDEEDDPDGAAPPQSQGGHRLGPGTCWACGCTEQRACMTPSGPCSWADETKTLCTNPKCLARAASDARRGRVSEPPPGPPFTCSGCEKPMRWADHGARGFGYSCATKGCSKRGLCSPLDDVCKSTFVHGAETLRCAIKVGADGRHALDHCFAGVTWNDAGERTQPRLKEKT